MIATEQNEELILQKTRDLCAALLEDRRFRDSREHLESFMADQAAQSQYREVSERGRVLREKQIQGQSLAETEIDEFEKMRFDLLNNPVAQNFIELQAQMNEVQDAINKMISKTFELGRVPEEEDLKCGDSSCGSGCGCH
ncbi:MAG: YlbF family regulator [Blastochloris sp.]|nr:YlbF family regulator [Blastochloris sp.]